MKTTLTIITFLATFLNAFAQINPDVKIEIDNKFQIMNCLNVPMANTSGTWKLIPNTKSAYWDGMFLGICTKNPNYPLHVKSQAMINSIITNQVNGNPNGKSLNIEAKKSVKDGAEIKLYSNTDPFGYGRIDFNSSNGNSNIGYAFVFSNFDGSAYNKHMIIRKNGKVSIGNAKNVNGDYKLYVEKGILTERLKLAINGSVEWADFVFDNNYNLPTLNEVETYINMYKHLPDIPSAEEVYENGIDVAKMNAKLLQKIEELTLYLINQEKRIQRLEDQLR
ncbi:MAG: hypothetical protein AAGA77_09990 [Bacteroidota bacterium]